MADLREFVYKGRRVRITVNHSAGHYIGVLDIEGMRLGADKVGAEASSAGAAFESRKRKAEELIDAQGGQPET